MKNKYCILFVMILCSCHFSSGTWKCVVLSDKKMITSLGNSVTPFATTMVLNYFFNHQIKNVDEIFLNIQQIYESEVITLHQLFDSHYKYYVDDLKKDYVSNIKMINDSYGSKEEIKCSDELYQLLKLSVKCYSLTNGYFNIFTGPLTSFWDECFLNANAYEDLSFYEPYFNLESKNKLEKIVEAIPHNEKEIQEQLTFNDQNKSVIFNKIKDSEMVPFINVGGIAKGFASDLIKEKLLKEGYFNGYMVHGGSSITTLSTPIFMKQENGQKVSILNPKKSNFFKKDIAFSMSFKEEFSFSTSGNYTMNKSYVFKDENHQSIRRHHIINPFTGYPENYHISVSVCSQTFSNAFLDVFSTALMCLSKQDGLKLKEKILSLFKGYDLEIFYLDEINEHDLQLFATSNVNQTLKVSDGIKVTYEE